MLVVRVHPEMLRSQGLPENCATRRPSGATATAPSWTWKVTCSATERASSKSSSIFRRRNSASDSSPASTSPIKNWKFSLADIQERKYWKRYQEAYEACLQATSTDHAPWYAVPADDKENARLIISQIVVDALADLKMEYPKATAKRHRELKSIRKLLERES